MEMGNMFEASHSPWSLTLTAVEIDRVRSMMAAINSRVDGKSIVWVRSAAPATRRWFVEGFQSRAFVDTAGADNDPTSPAAIPGYFLDSAHALAEAYGCVEVFYNENENVLTAHAGAEYVAVDAYDPEETIAPYDPVTDFEEMMGSKHMVNVAVRRDVIERLADGYQRSMRDIPDLNPPAAFTRLRFTRTTMQWTTDWSRWGRPVVSGMAPATCDREFDFEFYPLFMWSFVSCFLFEEEFNLGFDEEHVVLSGLDWAMWVRNVDEGVLRWGDRASEVFSEFGFERVEEISEFLMFVNDDIVINVVPVVGVAGPDCLNLSHTVVQNDDGTDLDLSVDALRELNEISAKLTNAKLCLYGNSIEIIVDIDNPRNSERFSDGVKAMLAAIGECAGLDTFLPLFATVPPGTPND